MEILHYNIETVMGNINTNDLHFLTKNELCELNLIGYTGKNSQGIPMTRVEYLNKLQKYGLFSIIQTKFDSGNLIEKFNVVRVITGYEPKAQPELEEHEKYEAQVKKVLIEVSDGELKGNNECDQFFLKVLENNSNAKPNVGWVIDLPEVIYKFNYMISELKKCVTALEKI